MTETKRKSPDLTKPQGLTRIPPWRPGMWVKVRAFSEGDYGSDLSGAVKRVRSLTAAITDPGQKRAVWRVHFDDGRCLEWHLIAREATPAEIRRAGG